MFFFMVFHTLSVLSSFSKLYLQGGPEDVQRFVTSEITEFAVLAAMQPSLYAANGAAPDYFIGSFCFDNVRDGKLFRPPSTLPNIVRHYEYFKIAELMVMDSVFAALAFLRTMEVD